MRALIFYCLAAALGDLVSSEEFVDITPIVFESRLRRHGPKFAPKNRKMFDRFDSSSIGDEDDIQVGSEVWTVDDLNKMSSPYATIEKMPDIYLEPGDKPLPIEDKVAIERSELTEETRDLINPEIGENCQYGYDGNYGNLAQRPAYGNSNGQVYGPYVNRQPVIRPVGEMTRTVKPVCTGPEGYRLEPLTEDVLKEEEYRPIYRKNHPDAYRRRPSSRRVKNLQDEAEVKIDRALDNVQIIQADDKVCNANLNTHEQVCEDKPCDGDKNPYKRPYPLSTLRDKVTVKDDCTGEIRTVTKGSSSNKIVVPSGQTIAIDPNRDELEISDRPYKRNLAYDRDYSRNVNLRKYSKNDEECDDIPVLKNKYDAENYYTKITRDRIRNNPIDDYDLNSEYYLTKDRYRSRNRNYKPILEDDCEDSYYTRNLNRATRRNYREDDCDYYEDYEYPINDKRYNYRNRGAYENYGKDPVLIDSREEIIHPEFPRRPNTRPKYTEHHGYLEDCDESYNYDKHNVRRPNKRRNPKNYYDRINSRSNGYPTKPVPKQEVYPQDQRVITDNCDNGATSPSQTTPHAIKTTTNQTTSKPVSSKVSTTPSVTPQSTTRPAIKQISTTSDSLNSVTAPSTNVDMNDSDLNSVIDKIKDQSLPGMNSTADASINQQLIAVVNDSDVSPKKDQDDKSSFLVKSLSKIASATGELKKKLKGDVKVPIIL